MPKTKISEFSATPGNNTDIDGINIGEGCAPSGINDAIRELMSQLKDFQAGTAGDSFNGPVGTTTAAAGAFTTLSASSTVSGTGFSTYLASPPAIGGTAAAAGSFTTLSASSSVTLSGGTANGVLYLNGSKVATSGTALTFDGNTFGLNVVGGAAINNVTSNLFLQAPVSGGAGFIFRDTSAGSYAEYMRLTSTGLGIGTSSPAYKVDAVGQIRAQESGTGSGDGNLIGATSSANGNAGVLFQTGGSSRWNFTTQGTNGANLRIYNYTLGSTVATFDSSGNLGLGVTPSAWGGGKAFEAGLAGNYFIGSTAASYTSIGTAAYYNGTNWIYARSTGASKYELLDNTHAWFTAPSGTAGNAISFTQAMTLDASGNLVLGTTSVAAAEGYRFYKNYGRYDNGTFTGFIGSGTSLGSSAASDFAFRSENALAFLAGGATERARITSGGNLLVGTTTNTYSSQIVSNGGITDFGSQYNVNLTGNDYSFVQRGASRAFTFYVDGASVVASLSATGVWTNASDARYKENVQPIQYGLDAVMQLKPREYNFIGQTQKQVGFIAQEVLDVVPEVVDSVSNSVTGEDRYTLSYGQMVAVLTKAIQEQQAIITELRQRVAALEAK